MNYKAIIEGLLFVSGEDGLSLETICNVTELSKDIVSSILKELFEDYKNESRGINIEFLGEKFKLTTKSEHKDFYKKLVNSDEHATLTQASIETLAIIAYNAPITRVEIDELRGVNSAYVLRKLLINDLIKEVGFSDSPGKPKLYNITQKFLDHFGLGSIDELPPIKIQKESEEDITEEDLFKSKYQEKNTE